MQMARLVSCVTTTLLVCGGCNPVKVTKLTDDATAQFLRRVEQGRDEEIYESAAPEFRRVSTREDLVRTTSLLRQKMGACSNFERKKVTFETTLRGPVVTTIVHATCDNGPLAESFTWLIENDRVLLLKFAADSPALH